MNLWYSYDPETGFDTHATAEEAQAAAEASLEHYRDYGSDGWHESTGDIAWGRLEEHASAHQRNVVETPGGEFDYTCDYQLVITRDYSHETAAQGELAAARNGIRDLRDERDECRRETKLACIALADSFVPKAIRDGAHLQGLPRLVAHAVAHHQWHHDAQDSSYVKTLEEQLHADNEQRVASSPVVPEGYEVEKDDDRWCLIRDGQHLLAQAGAHIVWSGNATAVDAVAALVWAIQHDQRPRHAGDTEAQ